MDNSVNQNDASDYTVVARRYRPRSFAELIGQDHIAQALDTAIESGRVGHAYLFTGARGVGKTSSARIFAKALNTSHDVDEAVAADIAQAVDAGEDMDVIEIDGASNRGIEEIRQLRANVSVRPSRARYKIYIIDEVHMLTNQAFNALLKTLEEPPPHVKFIFCTTDPDKLPITVLSRCQRFDFVPIKLDAIQARLKEICTAEGFTASDDALALLARRAAGSMRDSQSLLEQVMSFAVGEISVEQVQQLLGIADEGQLLAMAEALAASDALQAIGLFDLAARAGADAGQLGEQLLSYFRDLMAVGIGGGPELLKLANPAGHPKLKEVAERWGVQSILSAIQILDESLVRMRTSVSANALLEVALVQICQLSQLASIPALLDAVMGSGQRASAPPAQQIAKDPNGPTAASEKKNSDAKPDSNVVAASTASNPTPGAASTPSPASHDPASHAPARHSPEASAVAKPQAVSNGSQVREDVRQPAAAGPIDGGADTPSASTVVRMEAGQASASTKQDAASVASGVEASAAALQQWQTAIKSLNDMLADYAGLATAIVPKGSDHWEVVFPPGATRPREICEQAEKRSSLEQVVEQTLGRRVRLTFAVMQGELPRPTAKSQPSNNRVQKLREISDNPFVKKLCEIIDGEILRVDPPAQLQGPKAPQALSANQNS